MIYVPFKNITYQHTYGSMYAGIQSAMALCFQKPNLKFKNSTYHSSLFNELFGEVKVDSIFKYHTIIRNMNP